MSHIFLSYARADQARAEEMAQALQALGHEVWWDHDIQAGRDFGKAISDALDHAACVVVLWSQHSVESRWVLDESAEGLERQVLIPVLIDDIKPPLGFRRIEAANLAGWSGAQDHPEFQVLRRAIEQHAASATQASPAPTDSLTTLPPPEPMSEARTVEPRTDDVTEPEQRIEALRGARVRLLHSKTRKSEAASALQVLQAAGAAVTLETPGRGVHDSHRGRVYYRETRDMAALVDGMLQQAGTLIPTFLSDAPPDVDIVVCLLDDPTQPTPRNDVGDIKGIRGVRVRIVHAKELTDLAVDAATLLKGAGALATLTAPKSPQVVNRGKVHYHRDAASAGVVAEALGSFGAFEAERIEGPSSDFDIVVWFLPATLD